MKKISKIALKIFIISVIFILNLKLYTFAIIGLRHYEAISYGTAIFLMIWQWTQYIIPLIILLVLIMLNRKKLNIKKIIIFLIVCTILSGLLFTIGNIIERNTKKQEYNSLNVNTFEFNGKTIYYYKQL